MIQLPRLLANDLTERERLKPLNASLTLKLIGASEATMTMPDSSPDIAVHDFVSIYTQRGFSGIYRVTNVARNYAQRTEISLLHGIDILADSVWQEQIDFEGTTEEFLTELLNQQTHLINGVKPWVLGTCEDTTEIKKAINYDRLSNLLEELVEDGGTYYFSYDQTTFPWTVSLVSRPEVASTEFRLSRNARSASVTYNDADLCTRLILSDNHRSKDGDDEITTNKTAILTYDNLEAQAEWGVVIKTAAIDTADDIEEEVYTEADAWAADFLAKRAEPTVQIQIDGDELFGMTGDTWDEVSIGKMCRIALPAYNRTFLERVVSVTYSELLAKPDHVVVSLANSLPKFSESIAKLQDEMKKVSAGGAGGARSAVDPNEMQTWSQYVSYYGKALDGTDILTLYETGIDMDPIGGTKIHTLTEGVQSLYSYIQVESGRISLVVTGQGSSASINIQAITNAINQSSVTINADRIDLHGYVTADSLKTDIANIADLETQDLSVSGTLFVEDDCNFGQTAMTGASIGGKDVETEMPYVTNVENISASGSSNVTLRFSLGSGNPIDVTFSRGGQASGVSLSAASYIRETQEGSGVWQADTNVTLNGQTATKTLDVTAAVSRGYTLGQAAGYAAGWAAARLKCSYSESGGHGVIYFPPSTVDGAATASHWFGNTISMNKIRSQGGGVVVRSWSYGRHSTDGANWNNIDDSYREAEETYYP